MLRENAGYSQKTLTKPQQTDIAYSFLLGCDSCGGLSRCDRPLARLGAVSHGFEQRVSRCFGSVGALAQVPAILSATVLALIQPQHVPRYVV